MYGRGVSKERCSRMLSCGPGKARQGMHTENVQHTQGSRSHVVMPGLESYSET